MDSFGSYLRDIRKDAKLTQMEAANEIEVSRNAIQDWEKGVYVPEEEKISKLSRAYHVSKSEVLCMLKKCRRKEERTVYNWPDFLFDESTNAIVSELHLNFEHQELFGKLCIAGAITLERKYSTYEEIDLTKLSTESIEKMGGSIYVLKLKEELEYVLRYVQESFLKSQLIDNPDKEFDLCSLDKVAICNYIDCGYKTFFDEWDDANSPEENLHMNIKLKETLLLLSVLERKDIYWTDDNINNSDFKGSKELWKTNNRPREDVPKEFKKYKSIRTVPLRRDFYEWYEKDSDKGDYKECYIRITGKGKQLLEWWRGK